MKQSRGFMLVEIASSSALRLRSLHLHLLSAKLFTMTLASTFCNSSLAYGQFFHIVEQEFSAYEEENA